MTVTFEAGVAGDNHALYIAGDTADKGANLSAWSFFQRAGVVGAGATSASVPLSPFLTSRGFRFLRAFLVENALPYDTLIEAARQTGTQYLDTGICPGPTTVVTVDFKLDQIRTVQQRVFGVDSDDGTSLLSFDLYLPNATPRQWGTACSDGKGDWQWSGVEATVVRTRLSLDADTGAVTVYNYATAETSVIANSTRAATNRTATANATMLLCARNLVAEEVPAAANIICGGLIYSCDISDQGSLALALRPCVLSGRVGFYDSRSGSIFYSAVANDDFVVGGESVLCSPASGETQLSASSLLDIGSATDVYVWDGTVSGNWNMIDANWERNGTAGQSWTDGGDAVFNDRASVFTATIPDNTTVTPGSVTIYNTTDYTLASGDIDKGGLAGSGTFRKFGSGKLTITGVDHSLTGDMLFAGGEVVLTGSRDKVDITAGALGNPRVERDIVISNATLRVNGACPFTGGGQYTVKASARLKLYDSVLHLRTNATFNAGDVYLHNSTVYAHGGQGNNWGSLYADNLYVSGTQAIRIEPSLETDGKNKPNNNTGLCLGRSAQAVIDVPDMTGNSASDFIVSMPIRRGRYAYSYPHCGFRKTGAGTLELNGINADNCMSLSNYTGDVDVVEGTLKIGYGNATTEATRTSCFGLQGEANRHTFRVHPGATLHLLASDLQGQFYATSTVPIHVNGGTLSQEAKKTNGLGPVLLENAKVTCSGNSGLWPAFGFTGGLTVIGTNAVTVSGEDNAGVFFGNSDGSPSDCYVAEITGDGVADDTPDLTFGARLMDAPNWSTKHVATPLNMRKTGPGMLNLSNRHSTTTGRIEIVEGAVRLAVSVSSGEPCFECPTNSVIGNTTSPDLHVVVNGGTLWLDGTDVFGQGSTVNGMTIAVTNGTIRQSHGKINAMPFLDLYDATLEYSGANTGGTGDTTEFRPYGTFAFAQRVRFDGTRPYDLQDTGGTCYFSLGWQNDAYQEISGTKIYQHGKTEFHVADITANADVDVTIGVVLKPTLRWAGNTSGAVTNKLYSNTYFRTGLLKTGLGTLRLNSADASGKYYTEATRVNEGALLVDAGGFRSTNIIVQAGAYVGGTGTVARVTIEEGGGFTAAPGQTAALTMNALQLPPNGEVALDIPYVGDESGMNGYRVPVVAASGLTGVKWNVTINGTAATDGYSANAVIQNGVVYGTISRGGMVFLIR
ncbi:MAG: autotransporter-associated beta strand repeat-containing protein [Kiritimatiellae bacterium]|nr:autotransporter-associated beta strand repeat-containing protein [Kiritimatiellia bacterium]